MASKPKGSSSSSSSKSDASKVAVVYNDNENTYELTAEVNGTPVVFATVKAGTVDSAVDAAKQSSAE